jgi:hypothetical protein
MIAHRSNPLLNSACAHVRSPGPHFDTNSTSPLAIPFTMVVDSCVIRINNSAIDHATDGIQAGTKGLLRHPTTFRAEWGKPNVIAEQPPNKVLIAAALSKKLKHICIITRSPISFQSHIILTSSLWRKTSF